MLKMMGLSFAERSLPSPPPFRAAACSHAEETISSPSCEGLGASGRLALRACALVVTPSAPRDGLARCFPVWTSTDFTQFFDAGCPAKGPLLNHNHLRVVVGVIEQIDRRVEQLVVLTFATEAQLPLPPLRAAACSHAEETISSPSCDGPGASDRLILRACALVVTPSAFGGSARCCPFWRFTDFSRFFDADRSAKGP